MLKRILFIALALVYFIPVIGQDFFNTDFNSRKKYIIITNPTVRNVKTIQYLNNADLLDIKKRKMLFVGVYHNSQNYNFSQTKDYIQKHKLENFYLQEIKGELNEKNIFYNNDCSVQLKKVFDNSIGVFFFGGPDIPPAVYGKENTRSLVTDADRHYFETTFLFHLLGGSRNENFVSFLQNRPDYMVTGFCLGMQTMNVATGGTLIQDIPSEIYAAENDEETVALGRKNLHRNYWQNIEKDSLLMGINLHTIQFTTHPFFNKTVNVPKRWNPRVYSSHHQSADKLGKDMVVTALSPDGKIIEALAHKNYPNVFAVQFHPEVPALYEDIYVRKFHPEDSPMTYNDIIGKQSVRFHEKYWRHISNVLRKVKKK